MAMTISEQDRLTEFENKSTEAFLAVAAEIEKKAAAEAWSSQKTAEQVVGALADWARSMRAEANLTLAVAGGSAEFVDETTRIIGQFEKTAQGLDDLIAREAIPDFLTKSGAAFSASFAAFLAEAGGFALSVAQPA